MKQHERAWLIRQGFYPSDPWEHELTVYRKTGEYAFADLREALGLLRRPLILTGWWTVCFLAAVGWSILLVGLVG